MRAPEVIEVLEEWGWPLFDGSADSIFTVLGNTVFEEEDVTQLENPRAQTWVEVHPESLEGDLLIYPNGFDLEMYRRAVDAVMCPHGRLEHALDYFNSFSVETMKERLTDSPLPEMLGRRYDDDEEYPVLHITMFLPWDYEKASNTVEALVQVADEHRPSWHGTVGIKIVKALGRRLVLLGRA